MHVCTDTYLCAMSTCGVATSSQIGSDTGEVLDGLDGLGSREIAHIRPVASLTLSNPKQIHCAQGSKLC